MTAPTPVVPVSPSPVTAVLKFPWPQSCCDCPACRSNSKGTFSCCVNRLDCKELVEEPIGGGYSHPDWCPLILVTSRPLDAEVREDTWSEDEGEDE
jgi:hypothetical protein